MSEDIVRGFWTAMQSNDFENASRWLDPAFEYFMPQTGELLRGPSAFAALNSAYPAAGKWRFSVRKIIAQGQEAVSDVEITDGQMTARAVTFHEVENGLIRKQVEYWPDPYPAPAWRKAFVDIDPDYAF